MIFLDSNVSNDEINSINFYYKLNYPQEISIVYQTVRFY